ncbi:MAG: winged helix-turn-helix transcriptional regulator [Rhizobiales bacterium]|nr:metalloregulator ArsR/SmtB family transcription factor [Hyphomicrobiales bacterium]NRB15927.1 winged helix-turn-helix transcriptional regulator [Hyphomicrobiales bacterium]
MQTSIVENAQAQNAFKALADPTRRNILLRLSVEDLTIAELTQHFPMTRAAVKKHLLILEQGQLISVRVNGREKINHLEATGFKDAQAWMSYFDQFWDSKLMALNMAIANQQIQND